MAVAKKRRTSKKSTSRRKKAEVRKIPSKPFLANVQSESWLNEIFAVLFGVAALFLLVSILSHEFSVSEPLQYQTKLSAASRNVMGPIGHIVGTCLVGFMGWCSLVTVAWSAALAWVFWYWGAKDESFLPQVKSKLLLCVGLVGSVICCCGLGTIFWGKSAGGMFGNGISSFLVKYFNSTGATLICSGLLLISLSFASQKNTIQLVAYVGKMLRSVGRFLFITVPFAIFYCAVLVYNFLVELYDRFYQYRMKKRVEREMEEEPPVRVTEKELPKPKVRKKNKIPEPEPEPEEIVPAAPVVVMRKENSRKLSQKLIEKSRKLRTKVASKAPTEVDEDFSAYRLPELSHLAPGEPTEGGEDDNELREMSGLIEAKLRDFNIKGRVTEVHPGPVITLFEFEPAPGVKVGKIASLQDDLAMSLRADSIRIIAPIPKKGTVGIEVPNRVRDIVRLRDVLEDESFFNSKSILSVPLGKDTYGTPVIVDVAKMPHLLIAGATGTGKSVCINSILLSLLYRAAPSELGLILIDPKILELSVYDGIPHLKVPVVTVPTQAKAVLQWAVKEMDRRYRLMHRYGVRSVDAYNRLVEGDIDKGATESASEVSDGIVELSEQNIIEEGPLDKQSSEVSNLAEEHKIVEEMKAMTKIVIVIDELADLMLSVGREVEDLIARLAQKARAAGIHLIVATQRPSVDVITGLIKANFPARLSFRVSSRIDSRTILDSMGSEKLLGMGDSLYMPPGANGLMRLHGAFVADSEVTEVVEFIKSQYKPQYNQEIVAACEKALAEEAASKDGSSSGEVEYDALYDKAIEFVVEKGQASTSMLQRAFKIGYNRAARIIDTLEHEGVVGPMDGSRPRKVLASAVQEDLEMEQ